MTTVLFDAHQLGRRQTGNETYVRELLNALRPMDVEITAAVEATQRAVGVLGPPLRTARVPSNGVGRLAALTALAHRLRPDVIHAIYFLPPWVGRPTVVTIHDISFERYPQFFSRGALMRDRLFVRQSALRASRVVTVSEASRRDLIETYGLRPERVVAIPNGVSPAFHPSASMSSAHDKSERPVRLLGVGTLQPRKNLGRLIDAIALVSGELPISLRLVGPDGFQATEIRRRMRGRGDVTIVGYLSDDALAAEYRNADALVYPSIYEGFGLPVLEAMACGTPVITSTGGSLPEVAGDAAELVDPYDVEGLARAIIKVATQPDYAAGLQARGLARASEFTWDRSARRHLEVYQELAG